MDGNTILINPLSYCSISLVSSGPRSGYPGITVSQISNAGIPIIFVCNYAPINNAPLPRAEVGEGGDLHLRKIQIPTYWGSCSYIIPISRVADYGEGPATRLQSCTGCLKSVEILQSFSLEKVNFSVNCVIYP